jgi:hypothetical protein
MKTKIKRFVDLLFFGFVAVMVVRGIVTAIFEAVILKRISRNK